jgi:hypothetical protein
LQTEVCFFTSAKRQGGRGPHPTYRLCGEAFLLGVNWAEREADHSPMSVPVYLHDEHRGDLSLCSRFVGAVSDLFIVLSVVRAYQQQLQIDRLNTHFLSQISPLQSLFEFIYVCCMYFILLKVNVTEGRGFKSDGCSAECSIGYSSFFLRN